MTTVAELFAPRSPSQWGLAGRDSMTMMAKVLNNGSMGTPESRNCVASKFLIKCLLFCDKKKRKKKPKGSQLVSYATSSGPEGAAQRCSVCGT